MSKVYTKELTKELVKGYQVASESAESLTPDLAHDARSEFVDEFADTHKLTSRSVIGKLSREGVYIKKSYTTKSGAKPERKEDILTDIAKTMNVSADLLSGMEKATKNALVLFRDYITPDEGESEAGVITD